MIREYNKGHVVLQLKQREYHELLEYLECDQVRQESNGFRQLLDAFKNTSVIVDMVGFPRPPHEKLVTLPLPAYKVLRRIIAERHEYLQEQYMLFTKLRVELIQKGDIEEEDIGGYDEKEEED